MSNAGPDAVNYRFRSTPSYTVTLHHHRYDRIEEDHLGDARRSMARNIAGQFPTSRRMPNQRCPAKIKRVDELIQIVGPGVDIVAGSRLIGIAVTPPVMGDSTVTVVIEQQHLGFPPRTGQRPAVRENDRRSRAPVTIVDRSSVTGSDLGHGISPSLVERPMQRRVAMSHTRDSQERAVTSEECALTLPRDSVDVNEEQL